MPVQKEAIEQMTPSVGKVEKEVVQGAKEGEKEDK